MKKIKIFLFSSIFVLASFLAVGFYTFSPSVSYGLTSPVTFTVTDSDPNGYANCVIAPNQSTCSVGIDFSLNVNAKKTPNCPNTSENCVYTSDITSITTPTNIKVSWNNNGSVFWGYEECTGGTILGISNASCEYKFKASRVGKATHNITITCDEQTCNTATPFSLYNNFGSSDFDGYTARGTQLMGTATAIARCTYGYRWDETAKKCLLPADTFTINTCEIPLGASFCEAEVVWNVQNRAPQGSTSLTISSPPDDPKILSSASGRERFYPSGAVDDNTVITLKHNDLTLASSSVGYAHCIADTIWNFNNGGNMCLLDITPMEGRITATPCIIGGDTCQTTLQWRVWKNLASGGEEALPNDSEKMPEIILYENNNPVNIGGSDLITKGTNPYGDFMFDVGTMSPGGLTSFSGSTAKYTLPDVGIDYSPETQQSQAGIVNLEKIKTRSATFRLGAKYDVLEGQSKKTYYADLGSVTVNAVCATGSEWNDNTNRCMSLCASGSARSLSTNQCVPITVILTPFEISELDQTGSEVQTEKNWFSRFVGSTFSKFFAKRTTPVLKAGTWTRIDWEINNAVDLIGLENIECTDSNGKPYGKGMTYGSFNTVYPSSTTTYSVTCTY